jgi:hypothetical protein
MDRNESVPVGSSVFVLGYPVDQDISISPGIISNKTGPDGRWQTSTPMNPGNSGGPAFGESGLLVGFAVGGIVRWRSGDESVTVQGVNFIIPTLSLLSSPLLENLRALPDPAKCWALASSITAFDISIFSTLATAAKVSCTTSVLGESTCKQQSPPRGPAEFARSHTVAQIKDDHPSLTSRHSRGYQEKFTAEDGYRISECKSQASSANNADGIACEISRDGSSAMFRYRLASGPAFDRYRGWLFTTVTLRQRRI